DERKAGEVLRVLVDSEIQPEKTVPAYLGRLRRARNWVTAFDIVQRYKNSLSDTAEFVAAWASVIVAKQDSEAAREFLEASDLRGGPMLSDAHSSTLVRLLILGGRQEAADTLLNGLLSRALQKGLRSADLLETAHLFGSVGRQNEFEAKVRSAFGPSPET